MAITALYEDSATISTSEFSLPADSTSLSEIGTDGVYQCFLDLNALAAGDQFEFKIYEAVQAAGTKRLVETWTFDGAQGRPIFTSPALTLMHKWDMTLKKLAGTDRAIPWSIRQIS